MRTLLLNLVLLASLFASVLLNVYNSNHPVQKLSALPPSGIDLGNNVLTFPSNTSVYNSMNLTTGVFNGPSTHPDLQIIGTADPTLYTCLKDEDTGKGTCVSKTDDVGDAVALYADKDKICKGEPYCGDHGCACDMK